MKSIFYGWRVVAGAFVVALFGWGIGFYAPSVYLQATIDKHGWPIGLVSAAITFHFALGRWRSRNCRVCTSALASRA